MGEQACADVYTNQPMEWPACTSKATVAIVEVTKEPESGTLKKNLNELAAAVWRDFKLTNEHTAGKAAKFGAGVVVGGSSIQVWCSNAFVVGAIWFRGPSLRVRN